MKTMPIMILLALASVSTAFAEEGHDHDHAHAPIKGPNGGKVIEVDHAHVEFLVNPQRIVEVRFFDEKMKPVPVAGKKAEVIARASSGTTKVELAEKEGILTSDTALPEGAPYQIVLRVQPSAEGKMENVRIAYNTDICGTCKLQEYACICESQDGHDH